MKHMSVNKAEATNKYANLCAYASTLMALKKQHLALVLKSVSHIDAPL